MKKCIILASFIFISLFQGNLFDSKTVAVITKVVNDVHTKAGDNNWAKAKNGQTLKLSDALKTGNKSLALVKFTDNSVLTVRENSTILIGTEVNKKGVPEIINVEKGVIGFNIEKQEVEDFKFTTPQLIAAIRGTAGQIITQGDTTIVALKSGEILINALQGVKQSSILKAGEFVLVTKEGIVNSLPIPEQLQLLLDSNLKINLKKLIIKTDNGEIIIEYLE
ncbi:MAG: FecR domain-containing protein [Ignavibacteriaceae bacterium]|nr:FecR domain-containing protein [Ignavibacteriaceae bacterium]